MKKLISLLLCLAMAASLAAPVVFAEVEPYVNTPEDVALMQQAVVEMALSYYRRREHIRYDFEELTVQQEQAGPTRVTTKTPLGACAPDNLIYNNCAQFTYSVYWDCFRYGPAGVNGRNAYVAYYSGNVDADHPEMVLKFGKNGGMTDRQAFIEKAGELLQPGDIVNCLMTETLTNHSMLYVGEVPGEGEHMVCHSSGASSGHLGDNGAINMKLVDWDVFMGTGMFGFQNEAIDSITILRPLNALTPAQLTQDALGRLDYPGLDIIRMGDAWQYMDVLPGQEVEVSLTLKNSGTAAFTGLTVTDPAPVGAEVVSGSVSHGGTVRDGGVTWTPEIPAGQEVKLTYRLKVTADLGGEVLLPAGTVDRITTRTLSWYVGGTPVDEAPLRAMAEDPSVDPVVEGMTENTHIMDLDFANVFYKNVLGVDLGLPKTLQEVLDGMFVKEKIVGVTAAGGKMLMPKAYDDMSKAAQKVFDMTLPKHLGGYVVYLGADPENRYTDKRVYTYFPEGYRPGDIFVMHNGLTALSVRNAENVDVGIYLGDGCIAMAREDGTGLEIQVFETSVEKTLTSNVVLCLRPSCTFPDTLTAALYPEPEAPAEPETPTEPEAPGEPEAPVESGTPTGIFVGIAAAAVIAAVVVVVLKKKKK